MATYTLKRKIFFIGPDGTPITGEQLKANRVKGESLKDSLTRQGSDVAKKNAEMTAKRAAERAKNIANPGAAGAKAGFQRGAKSVGVMGGLKNTWNSGMKGKAGIIAGGALLAGLGAKALGGNKESY